MKKLLIALFLLFFTGLSVFADEIEETINRKVRESIDENQREYYLREKPLNEKSNQQIILRRNWLGVYVQVNGKVKVNPLTNTYEVE